ncbi:hypothetical protein GCM10022251_77500 [Phytohabitans flavus]
MTNPVRETGRLRNPRRKAAALTEEHLKAVRAAIREWQQPATGKPGPRQNGDLADASTSYSPPAPASARSSPCAGTTLTWLPNVQP